MTSEILRLPDSALTVIRRLNEAGYEAYMVGGCVRDHVMGVEPHDYDISTNATPDVVHTIFDRERVIDTGLKHGTVKVLMFGDDYEITTFRKDSDYDDGRHPSKVEFVSDLKTDMTRRDFTMNAIAYSMKSRFIDYFGGVQDIKHGIIRAVGDPEARFSEDYLRILRALRFASTLGFTIEKNTADAIHKLAIHLPQISKERITAELTKLLMGKNADIVLKEFGDVICVVLPELTPMLTTPQYHPWHCYDVWEHTATVVAGVKNKTPVMCWAALLHDSGKPDAISINPESGRTSFHGHPVHSARITKEIFAKRLRLSGQEMDDIYFLVANHDEMPSDSPKSVRKALAKFGSDRFEMLLQIKEADAAGFSDYGRDRTLLDIYRIRETWFKLDTQAIPVDQKKLAVNGRDVLDAGVPQGPEVGRILKQLFNMVMDEEIENDHDKLVEAIFQLTGGV